MNKKLARRGVCLHLTLAEILAETVSAMLTSLARVKLAQCKQNLARPWLGHGQGASVNRVYICLIYTYPDQAFAKSILASLAMAGRAFRFTLARQVMHCWRNIQFTFRQILLKLHVAHMNKKAHSAWVCVYTLPSPRSSPRQSPRV